VASSDDASLEGRKWRVPLTFGHRIGKSAEFHNLMLEEESLAVFLVSILQTWISLAYIRSSLLELDWA
jgi:hypothetical protein